MNITTPDWVQDAVFYQIFPDRFARSSRNPAGNLPFESWESLPTVHGYKGGELYGVAEKLDYLKELGVNVVWLSPVYKSPNDDNGYDISNYQDIMTEFGTLANWEDLLAEMHKRGIRLVMDLVVNHTSDEHPWFQEARKSKDNPYRDY